MALYIQHGHGKSDKITAALDDGAIDGVIFGARNEKPDKLRVYIKELRNVSEDCVLLLDPQFYVSTLNPPNDRYLPEYPYYSPGRTATSFTSGRSVRRYVKETLDCQVELGVDRLVSPTVIFDLFSDRWHQIALNLADASLEYHAGLSDPPPLLLSFVFAEEALAGINDINRFLDTITQDNWDMEGFYFIVGRNDPSYNQCFDSERLANFLYLVYALGQINGLRVICGYTDFVGILLRAAGAEAFATGWSQSLRQFDQRSFISRKSGGQPARERYSSSPLLNSVLLTELQTVYEVGYLTNVLSGVPLDDAITSAADPLASDWTRALSQQQHWQTLAVLDETLSGRVRNDLREIVRRLENASGLYAILQGGSVQFGRYTDGRHLPEWVEAIQTFRRMAGFASP